MHTYLPRVANEPMVSGESGLCNMTSQAREFARLWLVAIGDRARLVRCDSRLTLAAQKHAEFLSAQPFDAIKDKRHIGQGGSSANQRVRAEGYPLPSHWPDDGNQVECATPASEGAALALKKFLLSPAHRVAMMGEGFWLASTVYAVGHSGREWVFLCAPEEGS